MANAVANNQTPNGWFSAGQKKFITYTAITVGSITVGGLVFLITRRQLRKAKANKAETQTLTEGNAENYAQLIIMSFDHWYGVSMGELRNVMVSIPDMATFDKVATKYEVLTKQAKGALYRDLKNKLSQSEYREISGILKGKPAKPGVKPVFDWNSAIGIAHRVKAALDDKVWGISYADDEALESALREIPSLTAFAMVKIQYKKDYKKEIEPELDGVHGFKWKEIVYTKPKTVGNEKYK